MRQTPGGQNISHAGNNGLNQLWDDSFYQNKLIALWSKIASRYSHEKIVIGYDLFNEPVAPKKEVLNQIYSDLTNAIRKVDKNHVIFLEGNNWAKDIHEINIQNDKNTALSMHFYTPGIYAVKGELTYPSIIQGKEFNKKTLSAEFNKQIAYAKNNNILLWIGEFGAMSRAGNYLSYDRDLIEIINKHNLSWTYWNYKNIRGR